MLRGGVIIFACLESKLFLGKQVFRHQILGISVCFLGFVMVGFASLIHKTDLTSKFSGAESGSAQTIMGLVMILISIVIQATQFVVEEKILETYEISPMRMVGVGIFWVV
jgi:drug/metabolite transporter (DMT)-like permease